MATAAAGASLVEVVVLVALARVSPRRPTPNQMAATATKTTNTRTAMRFETFMEDVPAYAGWHSCGQQKVILPGSDPQPRRLEATTLQ
jgi:hypothetical protein